MPTKKSKGPRTLAIDVGGSGLKATVLDEKGKLLSERLRVVTPAGEPPARTVDALVDLASKLPSYDRVSVGFPGVVNKGVVKTAPNLGHASWAGFDLGRSLELKLGKPVRVANDADVQGLAVISGRGVEMVVTLGTGFGTGLYQDGRLAPHLEIAHHPFRKGKTYDQQVGDKARRKIGTKRWSRRVWKAIANLRTMVNFDRLYIGGGNAKRLDFDLPADCRRIDNVAGLLGGVKLWD